MFKFLNKTLIILLISFLPLISVAAVPAWQIVPNESSITFIAIQNGAPISGKFTSFSGEINADPDKLAESNVKILVDLGSITDPSNQLADTLQSPDWFNVKLFPQAIFKSNQFTKTGKKTYQAKGTLTIRDKTLPIMLSFTQEEYTPTKARVRGTTTLKRLAFGVGQGEWSDTNAIKDDVRVDFILTAVKK